MSTVCGPNDPTAIEGNGNCLIGIDGNVIVPDEADPSGTGCVLTPSGFVCPNNVTCDYWQLSQSPESCIMEDYIAESITIGGAPVKVHKLLGVHEQGRLVDLTGQGEAISSSSLGNFPASNAFTAFITEWRSAEVGTGVIARSFIGYDFGPIRLDNGRLRYGVETYLKNDVSRIKIKQGCDSKNRVTKIRLERSDDGVNWFGVGVANLPDCDGLVQVDFKKTVPARWWRIRPVQFNGGPDDYWSVVALQLMDYEKTNINNIQDRILLENRDRDYSGEPIAFKASYQPIDIQSDSAKQGFMFNANQHILEVSFKETIAKLGRPFVIGDIIELIPEAQFTTSLERVRKYVEVIDVGWSTNGYTPTWVPTMQRLVCEPALASQETQDIFGKLNADLIDRGDLFDINDGNSKTYQDVSNITKTIKADANTQNPQDGRDFANKTELSQELLDRGHELGIPLRRLDRQRRGYDTDALPPNGLPYTQGDAFPANPNNGDYHRLTYENIRSGIPPRLYRYSTAKNRWLFIETDNRSRYVNGRSMLEDYKNGAKGDPVRNDQLDT